MIKYTSQQYRLETLLSLKILKYLSKYGVNSMEDISNLFDRSFRTVSPVVNDKMVELTGFPSRQDYIIDFLDSMKTDGFIRYENHSELFKGNEHERPWLWPVKIKACITIEGLKFIRNEQSHRRAIQAERRANLSLFISVIAILIALVTFLMNMIIPHL